MALDPESSGAGGGAQSIVHDDSEFANPMRAAAEALREIARIGDTPQCDTTEVELEYYDTFPNLNIPGESAVLRLVADWLEQQVPRPAQGAEVPEDLVERLAETIAECLGRGESVPDVARAVLAEIAWHGAPPAWQQFRADVERELKVREERVTELEAELKQAQSSYGLCYDDRNRSEADLAIVTRERDSATTELSYCQQLVAEVRATFRKHGLAAGPTAIDRLVEQRDSLTRELAEAKEELRVLSDLERRARASPVWGPLIGALSALDAHRAKTSGRQAPDAEPSITPGSANEPAVPELPYETAPRLTKGVEYEVRERLVSKSLFLIGHRFIATGNESRDAKGDDWFQLPPSQSAYRVVRVEPEKAECPRCKGRRTVPGDCGDSPNQWEDPCPQCAVEPEAKATTTYLPWRVGTRVGRNIYDASGRDIGRMDTAELAARVVEAVNGATTVADLVRRVERLEGWLALPTAGPAAEAIEEEIRAERAGRKS